MEEVLDRAQLAVAADERRFEPVRLEGAAQAGHDPKRTPQRRQPLLALELEGSRVFVDHGLLGRAPRRLADEHAPGRRRRLDARRGVDEVAGDHALPLGAERHRRLAGEDTRAGTQLVGSDLVAERGDGRDEVERGADGALRVVLRRGRRAPDGHDRVADELLHGAAVDGDDPPADVEVAGEELAHLLGVARLRQGREADEVGEQHGDEPALGRRLRPRRGGNLGCQRRAAVAAEGVAGLVGGAAGRAGERERRAAAGAELPAGAVLGRAGGTDHHPTKSRSERFGLPSRRRR